MSNGMQNPYLIIKEQLHLSVYPIPFNGFTTRLIILFFLCTYLFVMTIIFLIIYWISLRRQHKPFWLFKFIKGKYLIGNIHCQVALNLFTSIVIAMEIRNTYNIFINQFSQRNTFVWRNSIWLIVWLQGWMSGFALISCLLLNHSNSIKSESLWLNAKIVNSIYIGFPFLAVAGLLTPGLMASTSWNFLSDQFDTLNDILSQASDTYIATGQLSPNVAGQMQSIEAAFFTRIAAFYNEYLALNISWAIASLILVALNMSGIWLVIRLHHQIVFSQLNLNDESELTSLPARQSQPILHHQPSSDHHPLPPALVTRPVISHQPYSDGAFQNLSPGGMSSSVSNSPVIIEWEQKESNRMSNRIVGVKSEKIVAMKKLKRDLIITISGVTAIALAFSANALLLAIIRFGLYQHWATAEVGLTLLPWIYLVIQSALVTGLTYNQIRFNLDAHRPPSPPLNVNPYLSSNYNRSPYNPPRPSSINTKMDSPRTFSDDLDAPRSPSIALSPPYSPHIYSQSPMSSPQQQDHHHSRHLSPVIITSEQVTRSDHHHHRSLSASSYRKPPPPVAQAPTSIQFNEFDFTQVMLRESGDTLEEWKPDQMKQILNE